MQLAAGNELMIPRTTQCGVSTNCPLLSGLQVTFRMPNPLSTGLSEIRAAILKSRRMTFIYKKQRVVADFYLLGHTRKTGAYVILAWCHGAVAEWRLIRYALIKELEPAGLIETLRDDFDPRHPKIATVDTIAYYPRRPLH